MKVLTFSRHFPKGHPKVGNPTWFVESILNVIMRPEGALRLDYIPDQVRELVNDFTLIANERQKHHTIRAGNRWKTGDMASLRIWSGAPYRSKQIEFARVEVKKVWEFEIWISDRIMVGVPEIPGMQLRMLPLCEVAANDGLECSDFEEWFRIHPKKNERHIFTGQVICWSDKVDYGKIEY